MNEITLWVPDLPGRALSPNGSHGSWSSVAQARSFYRTRCKLLFQEQRDALGELAPAAYRHAEVLVHASFCRLPDPPYQRIDMYRPRDVPNLVSALKPLYDALKDAALIVDDDARHMRLGMHVIDEVRDWSLEGISVTVAEVY